MTKCPKCGTENQKPARQWTGGAKAGKSMEVGRFVCASCGTSYVTCHDSETGAVRTMTRRS